MVADPSSPLNASKSSKSLFGLLSCGAQLASPSSWCPLIRKCCALHRRLARAWVKVVASPNQVDLSSLLWLDWFRKVQKFSTCAFIYTWTHLDLLFWSHELFYRALDNPPAGFLEWSKRSIFLETGKLWQTCGFYRHSAAIWDAIQRSTNPPFLKTTYSHGSCEDCTRYPYNKYINYVMTPWQIATERCLMDPTGVCKRAKMRDQTLHHCVIHRTALFELVAILPDKGFQSSGS